MAVPRNRHSNARKKSKRSHHAKRPLALCPCRDCGQLTLPHRMCLSCRAYKGVQILALNAPK